MKEKVDNKFVAAALILAGLFIWSCGFQMGVNHERILLDKFSFASSTNSGYTIPVKLVPVTNLLPNRVDINFPPLSVE